MGCLWAPWDLDVAGIMGAPLGWFRVVEPQIERTFGRVCQVASTALRGRGRRIQIAGSVRPSRPSQHVLSGAGANVLRSHIRSSHSGRVAYLSESADRQLCAGLRHDAVALLCAGGAE